MERFFSGVLAAMMITTAVAQEGFSTGPVFDDFGPTAAVDADFDVPTDAEFKLAFDVAKKAEAGSLNKTLVSAARFINMHAGAGVARENMNVVVVVHGGAVKDVAKAKDGEENANTALVEALTKEGVRIVVCGQSAAYYKVATADLLPNVEMALSAMTAHALLQSEGYALNPF